MAANLSPRVQHLVSEAAGLTPDELTALVSAIQSLPRRGAPEDRRDEIAARVARVHAGDVTTQSVDDVERALRDELDF